MAGVKAEEGGIIPKPKPQGVSVTAIAGGDRAAIQGVVGEGPVGGDRAEFRGVAAEGKAGQLGPVTLDATAQVVNNTSVDITLGAAVSVGAEVIRAPFSLLGIAEHIASDPNYYRRLSEFASAELTQEIAKFHGQGNADLVIKGELVELQQGFAEIARYIGTKAYDAAAAVVVSLKDGLVAFHDSHPELVDIFGKLAAVSLSTYTLGAIGVPVTLGVCVTASVVNSEKLADILKAWKGK